MNHRTYFEDIGAWPKDELSAWHYIAGFIACATFTLIAYAFARSGAHGATIIVVALACAQLLAQLVFFLHLGFNRASRARLAMFGFALVVVIIVVTGSLWIMSSLNARMTMDPTMMQQYMNAQLGF